MDDGIRVTFQGDAAGAGLALRMWEACHWNGSAPAAATGDGIWRCARLLPPVEVFYRIILSEPLTSIRRVDGLDCELNLLLPIGTFKGSGGHVVGA